MSVMETDAVKRERQRRQAELRRAQRPAQATPTAEPKKLKRARGWRLRAINAGLIPPPPGYEGPPDEVT